MHICLSTREIPAHFSFRGYAFSTTRLSFSARDPFGIPAILQLVAPVLHPHVACLDTHRPKCRGIAQILRTPGSYPFLLFARLSLPASVSSAFSHSSSTTSITVGSSFRRQQTDFAAPKTRALMAVPHSHSTIHQRHLSINEMCAGQCELCVAPSITSGNEENFCPCSQLKPSSRLKPVPISFELSPSVVSCRLLYFVHSAQDSCLPVRRSEL